MDDIVSHETVDMRKEVEVLKDVLVLKSEQIKSIMNQLTRLEKDINSIKQDKMNFADRERILVERIDREINERRESDKQNSAKLTKHIDKEITDVKKVIESNKDESATESKSLKDEIRPIKTDIYYMKSQILLIQAPIGTGHIEARYDWVIDGDLRYRGWDLGYKNSGYFTGAVHPYKYQLALTNRIDTDSMYTYVMDCINGAKSMFIWLRIHDSPNDGTLAWPFERRVNVTVTDKGKPEACSTISKLCKIARPDYQYRRSDEFVFHFAELIEAGIDLSLGVRVSCVIFSDTAQ